MEWSVCSDGANLHHRFEFGLTRDVPTHTCAADVIMSWRSFQHVSTSFCVRDEGGSDSHEVYLDVQVGRDSVR